MKKKVFLVFAMLMAVFLMVGCGSEGEEENGDNNGGGNNVSNGSAGVHLGIIGFNYKLTEMDIRLLSSNASDFTSFIDSLDRENNTALYYADDMALERLKKYNKPPKLEHVALVTFTDGIDNQSIAPGLKPEYATPDEYLDSLSNKIHSEKIHGLSVESYTIGLRTADDMEDSLKPRFDAMLNKLATNSNYAFPVDNMDEVQQHFADIADSLIQVSKSINYGVYMPSGYPSGQIRYTFDNADSAESSELYIEASYNKNNTTLENIRYHGFAQGATTIKGREGIKGTLFYRFDDLRYSNGSSVSEGMSFTLWQQIEGKWKSETEITPEDYPPEVTKDMSSALIMLVLDCTTSLSESNFRIMKDAAKEFIRTLANAGFGTGNSGSDNSGSNPDSGDSGTPDTGDTQSGNTDTCVDIYQCSTNCADQACLEACIANGTSTDQNLFVTMYNCWGNNCANATTSDEFTDCISANCANETEACGLSVPKQGDTTYSAPYGTLQINVSSTYLLTNESQLQQNMVNMSSFATGNLGSSDIVPAGAGMSYYYAALVQDGGDQYYQIVQNFTDSTGQTQLNPGIFIILPASVSVGTVHFGLDNESVGQMFVVDFNGNNVGCYHGFGYGDLTVTSANPAAGASGNIAMNGTIEIYSAANAPMYGGDITSQLNGWVNCAPR